MNKHTKVVTLFAAANALLNASATLQAAEQVVDAKIAQSAVDDLFGILPITVLRANADQDGFGVVPAMLDCLEQAKANYLAGDLTALAVSIALVKNDSSGNDNYAITLSFTSDAGHGSWAVGRVEMKDGSTLRTVLDIDRYTFNNEPLSTPLSQLLRVSLEDFGDAYMMQNLIFPNLPTTQEIAIANGVFSQYQHLLDAV